MCGHQNDVMLRRRRVASSGDHETKLHRLTDYELRRRRETKQRRRSSGGVTAVICCCAVFLASVDGATVTGKSFPATESSILKSYSNSTVILVHSDEKKTHKENHSEQNVLNGNFLVRKIRNSVTGKDAEVQNGISSSQSHGRKNRPITNVGRSTYAKGLKKSHRQIQVSKIENRRQSLSAHDHLLKQYSLVGISGKIKRSYGQTHSVPEDRVLLRPEGFSNRSPKIKRYEILEGEDVSRIPRNQALRLPSDWQLQISRISNEPITFSRNGEVWKRKNVVVSSTPSMFVPLQDSLSKSVVIRNASYGSSQLSKWTVPNSFSVSRISERMITPSLTSAIITDRSVNREKFPIKCIQSLYLHPPPTTTPSSWYRMPDSSGRINRTTIQAWPVSRLPRASELGKVSATAPYIDRATPETVTAYSGKTAIIPCMVNNLGQRSVSNIRE
ncbi:hypothetical protein FHG87_017728 [Trinorchestia longiramus]|nr:hypothetical protein FHG87_017728 [Trinorchestia longiramus]